MTDPDITLYHCPTACSQVAVCALEWAGLPYRLELIDVPSGQQYSPEYRAISPLGKIPYAVIDGVGLGENLAIISLVAAARPESGVFPVLASPRERAEVLSGLAFCSSTLHPQVRGLFAPQRFTAGETEGVRAKARELAALSYAYADRRLATHGWWLGELSIVDVYLNWTASIAAKGGFDFHPYSQIAMLPERLETLPAFVAMQRIEAESVAKLAASTPPVNG